MRAVFAGLGACALFIVARVLIAWFQHLNNRVFKLHARIARNTTMLNQLTPNAPRFAKVHQDEFSSMWFQPTASNNCYTYANSLFAAERVTELRRPGGITPFGKITVDTLIQRLVEDGWRPGVPDHVVEHAHIALAFVRSGVNGLDDDYHFYRLGPDGWSHRPGEFRAEMVDDPFADAREHHYSQFAGWWVVPHGPENRPRHLWARLTGAATIPLDDSLH